MSRGSRRRQRGAALVMALLALMVLTLLGLALTALAARLQVRR